MPPKEQLYLGIDQGSSSTKACLLDSHANEVWTSKLEVGTNFISAKEIEQGPRELLESIRQLVKFAETESIALNAKIEAIGFSLQRSGVCAWKEDEIVHPLLSWRDTRNQEVIKKLSDVAVEISNLSGLPLNAHYAASKIALLQKTYPDARVGFLDSYIFAALNEFKIFVTEHSYAARSQLFNLGHSGWSERLCSLFNVDHKRLPEIKPSFNKFATISGIPIVASIGDQQAAVIGNQAANSTVLNLGTVASLLVPTGTKPCHFRGYLSGVLYATEHQVQYLLEATTNACGSVLDYLYDLLGVRSTLSELNNLAQQAAGKLKAGEGTIAFLPCSGTATPFWRTNLAPHIVNWDKNDKADLIRAALENIGNFIAYQILDLSKQEVISADQIIVSGGLSEIDYLLEHISNLSSKTLLVAGEQNASARGAAIMAMGPTQLRGELRSLSTRKIIKPHSSISRASQTATQRYQRWLELYKP